MNSQTHTTKATEGRAAANSLSAIVKQSNESLLSLPAVKPYDLSTVAFGDKVIQLGIIPTHTSSYHNNKSFEKAGRGDGKDNDLAQIVTTIIDSNSCNDVFSARNQLKKLIENRKKEQRYLDSTRQSTPEKKESHEKRIEFEERLLEKLEAAYRKLFGLDTQQTQVQNTAGGGAAAQAGNTSDAFNQQSNSGATSSVTMSWVEMMRNQNNASGTQTNNSAAAAAHASGAAQTSSQPDASRQQPNNRAAPAAVAGGAAQTGSQPNAFTQQPTNRSAPAAVGGWAALFGNRPNASGSQINNGVAPAAIASGAAQAGNQTQANRPLTNNRQATATANNVGNKAFRAGKAEQSRKQEAKKGNKKNDDDDG